MATGGSLVVQRGNRVSTGVGIPELVEEVIPSPQAKTQNIQTGLLDTSMPRPYQG
jgi:hypothetical protein